MATKQKNMDKEQVDDRVFPWCSPIPKDEYIVCAAIWYKELKAPVISVRNVNRGVVVCGHRHGHCIGVLLSLSGKRSVLPEVGEYEQGFLTSKNRFVSREEAAEIAYKIGQIKEPIKTLFSEDIY